MSVDDEAARHSKRGLLLVTMEVETGFDEEFNRWYNEEHVPERLSCPGFINARRFVTAGETRKYLALYDLVDPSVLESPQYQRVGRRTPWGEKVLRRVTAMTREVYTEIGRWDGRVAHEDR